MNTSTIALEMVADDDCYILSILSVKQEGYAEINTYITPASLNPGTRVRSVKYFCFSKVQSVGIDPGISNVQDIFTNDANWCLVGIFVVCANIKLIASLSILQPTTSIFRARATRPSGHIRVITGEF
jgi:hypothetical protein